MAQRQREGVDGCSADSTGRALASRQKIERRQGIGKVDAEEVQGCKRQSGLCIDQRKDRERQKQVREGCIGVVRKIERAR